MKLVAAIYVDEKCKKNDWMGRREGEVGVYFTWKSHGVGASYGPPKWEDDDS